VWLRARNCLNTAQNAAVVSRTRTWNICGTPGRIEVAMAMLEQSVMLTKSISNDNSESDFYLFRCVRSRQGLAHLALKPAGRFKWLGLLAQFGEHELIAKKCLHLNCVLKRAAQESCSQVDSSHENLIIELAFFAVLSWIYISSPGGGRKKMAFFIIFFWKKTPYHSWCCVRGVLPLTSCLSRPFLQLA